MRSKSASSEKTSEGENIPLARIVSVLVEEGLHVRWRIGVLEGHPDTFSGNSLAFRLVGRFHMYRGINSTIMVSFCPFRPGLVRLASTGNRVGGALSDVRGLPRVHLPPAPTVALHQHDYEGRVHIGDDTPTRLRAGDLTLTPAGTESRYHLPKPRAPPVHSLQHHSRCPEEEAHRARPALPPAARGGLGPHPPAHLVDHRPAPPGRALGPAQERPGPRRRLRRAPRN